MKHLLNPISYKIISTHAYQHSHAELVLMQAKLIFELEQCFKKNESDRSTYKILDILVTPRFLKLFVIKTRPDGLSQKTYLYDRNRHILYSDRTFFNRHVDSAALNTLIPTYSDLLSHFKVSFSNADTMPSGIHPVMIIQNLFKQIRHSFFNLPVNIPKDIDLSSHSSLEFYSRIKDHQALIDCVKQATSNIVKHDSRVFSTETWSVSSATLSSTLHNVGSLIEKSHLSPQFASMSIKTDPIFTSDHTSKFNYLSDANILKVFNHSEIYEYGQDCWSSTEKTSGSHKNNDFYKKIIIGSTTFRLMADGAGSSHQYFNARYIADHFDSTEGEALLSLVFQDCESGNSQKAAQLLQTFISSSLNNNRFDMFTFCLCFVCGTDLHTFYTGDTHAVVYCNNSDTSVSKLSNMILLTPDGRSRSYTSDPDGIAPFKSYTLHHSRHSISKCNLTVLMGTDGLFDRLSCFTGKDIIESFSQDSLVKNSRSFVSINLHALNMVFKLLDGDPKKIHAMLYLWCQHLPVKEDDTTFSVFKIISKDYSARGVNEMTDLIEHKLPVSSSPIGLSID